MVRLILSKESTMLGKISNSDFSFGLMDSIHRIIARILLHCIPMLGAQCLQVAHKLGTSTDHAYSDAH
jgi:hypothetical protein